MIDEKKLIEEITTFGERMTNNGMQGDFHIKIIKAITDIIAKQPKVCEWTPCSEGLPELTEGTEYFKQSECCLVALKWWDGDITESVGWYNESGLWSDDGKNCKVIAWQPLPAPYKEDMRKKVE